MLFLVKAESRPLAEFFKGIPHCIHQVIEVINGFIQLLSCLTINIPCVVTDFSNEVHTFRMNNNVKILNIINTVVYTVFALPCPVNMGKP